MNRREFISRSALATAGSLLIPNFLKAYEQQQLHTKMLTDKRLVIIQLSGGNDGLNTVVPFQNDNYYKLRPTLGIEKSKVLPLTDELGFNPAMTGMKKLFDDGLLTVINSVGYPNPDRSHFRSMDIWQTASDSDRFLSSGWIGRYLDAQCNGTCVPFDAVEVDDTLSLALKGENVNGLAVQNPQKLYQQTREKLFTDISRNHPEAHADNVGYLYKTLSETISSAGYIYDKASIQKTKATYPATELGNKLKTVAELILSGVETNVFYVALSGFDTHVQQAVKQPQLLKQYSDALLTFMDDMKETGKLNNTLVMTFSEFGRRVSQNGSGGTDHGTANNLFLAGGSLKKPGFYNHSPQLTDLDEGDLKFEIDFRQIYATLLNNWLNVNETQILGKKFDLLPVLT